jgi:hypothetical protein
MKFLMLSLALVAAIVLAGSASANDPVLGLGPDVALQPAVGLLGRPTAIAVSGVEARSLQVRLAGATSVVGRPLPWRSLTFTRGAWRGVLPAPDLRGIYPVQLRVAPGSPVLHSSRWLYRVFARGTLSRPSFGVPEDVARWWVQTRPGNAKVVAVKLWPRPDFDRRDRRLHRLLVIAYTLAGHERVRDRLGIFVTAVRDGYDGRWRMLEAKATP